MKDLLRKPLSVRVQGRAAAIWIEVAVGLTVSILAVGLTLLLQPLLHGEVPFALVFVAVTLATVLAGWRSGLVAMATAQLALWWAIIGHRWSFVIDDPAQISALVVATFSEVIVLVTIALYQSEVRRAWSARNLADRRRELLVGELAHRVKNTLSVVQSVARQSLSSGSRADALAAFEARLANIASSHDLITENDWEPAAIAEVVRRSIANFGGTPDPFVLSGPMVVVSPKRAVNLSLALHELATNAVKYGALSTPGGRVLISWNVTPDATFTLKWSETGGPPVAPPSRKGFGSRMIERGIAAEMGGVVDLVFAPTGLTCTIRGVVEQVEGVGPPTPSDPG